MNLLRKRSLEGEKKVQVLELDNVVPGYNKQTVLCDVSFKLQEPSISVVLGSNGAGKTTD
jgi:ABC-type cobalamin/Fe3+-siderophores transport system ATPase subunit